jgi:hypothetical protein
MRGHNWTHKTEPKRWAKLVKVIQFTTHVFRDVYTQIRDEGKAAVGVARAKIEVWECVYVCFCEYCDRYEQVCICMHDYMYACLQESID